MINIPQRAKTDIPGFDKLINGGFPRNFNILLAGGPGTGKSIFSMQYLVNGAKKHDEKGLFVSFEQREEQLRSQASQFGWDLLALEKSKKLELMYIPVKKIKKNTINKIKNYVKKNKVKRLVLDSLSTLMINAPIYSNLSDMSLVDAMSNKTFYSPPIVGEQVVNKFLYEFIDELRDLDCTTILIAEAGQPDKTTGEVVLGEYACDGVVKINFESLGGEFSRSMIIRKMRETNNNDDVHPVEIDKKGFVVHKLE